MKTREEASSSQPVEQADNGEDRRLWEAQQEVSELRSRLAEEIERERILELEIGAVRKDLEVKVTYARALEEAAEERKAHLAWLQVHFDRERDRADRAEAELAAERSRLYYRIFQPVLRALRGRGES
ncbi:MAG: hypothetical protein M0Z30_12830 [Actinomycetota bacterium]|nr:hypothetical protein [Actinomycetota bacterium]